MALSLWWAATGPVRAQVDQPEPAPRAPATDVEAIDRLVEQSRILITDRGSSPQARRIVATQLLRNPAPAARNLVLELLAAESVSAPKIAVCEALEEMLPRAGSSLMDARLSAGVLDLLDDPESSVRAAAVAVLVRLDDDAVVKRLGDRARDVDRSADGRLAAVDALAARAVSRRNAIGRLVHLVSTANDEAVVNRARQALGAVALEDPGTGPQEWRRWWEAKSAMNETQWLADRVDLLARRLRAAEEQTESLRRDGAARYDALARRVRDTLRANYRLTAESQRAALLVEWLADEQVEFRRAAALLISERISEGIKPSPEVKAAVRALIDDVDGDLRRRALVIIEALNDPTDAPFVLSHLTEERNPAVRATMLKVLGRLRNPDAIAHLVDEMNDAAAPPSCVAAAAESLGLLSNAAQTDPTAMVPAVPSLKARYAALDESEVDLRVALLGAMARIGVEQFTEEFVENVSAANPDLLVHAVEGLMAVGDSGRLDVLVALTSHPDPRVRRRAIAAVGALGSGLLHLNALAARANPSAEPSEDARKLAWSGVRSVLRKQHPDDRLQWVIRHELTQEQREACLSDLVADLAAGDSEAEVTMAAKRALAETLDRRDKYTASIALWQELYDALRGAGDPQAELTALRLLQATLRSGRFDGLGALLANIGEGASAGHKRRLEDVVHTYVDELQAGTDKNTLELLSECLDRLPEDALPIGWRERLGATALSAPPDTSTDPSAGP